MPLPIQASFIVQADLRQKVEQGAVDTEQGSLARNCPGSSKLISSSFRKNPEAIWQVVMNARPPRAEKQLARPPICIMPPQAMISTTQPKKVSSGSQSSNGNDSKS